MGCKAPCHTDGFFDGTTRTRFEAALAKLALRSYSLRPRVPAKIFATVTRCLGSAGRMLKDEQLRILDNIREFERTFEQRYGRKMNTEEVHVLQAARELAKK